jgi:hypothetical protein
VRNECNERKDVERQELISKSAAKYLRAYNVSVIPLRDDKRPDRPWVDYQNRQASVDEAINWSATNIGIVTGAISGIVVVDCESREDATWFWKERGQSNVMVQTPRGFHLYFRTPGCHVPNAQRVEGRYDIRGDGGYVVAPPSIVNGKQYAFVNGLSMRPASEMVPFRMEWRYPPNQTQSQGPQPRENRKVTDGVAYIRTMHAIAGQAGHNMTYKAVCRLRDAGMTATEALAAMIEWNQTNADPAWTTAELLHKVNGVYGGK